MGGVRGTKIFEKIRENALFSDLIFIRKVCASHTVDFRIPLEKIINIEHEIFEDVKLIDDELTKINKSWCKTVHPDKNYKECISNLLEEKMKAILTWLKEWDYLDKGNLHYLPYMKNLKIQ